MSELLYNTNVHADAFLKSGLSFRESFAPSMNPDGFATYRHLISPNRSTREGELASDFQTHSQLSFLMDIQILVL